MSKATSSGGSAGFPGVATGLLCAAIAAGCGSVRPADEDGGADGQADADPSDDTTPPTITATAPVSKAASVAREVAITATFSEGMDPATVTGETFQVTIDGEAISGDVTYDGLVATFTPDPPLLGATSYRATVTSGATDEAGNPLAGSREWDFTTLTTACVKPDGGDGCHPTIGAAVAAVGAGESIAVATGIYMENVVITKTLTLLGGFSEEFDQRDVPALESRIRPADASLQVVAINGAFNDTPAVAPIIDGFTVTGGRNENEHGGAFRIANSDTVLRNNIIIDNTAAFLGGGVYVQNGAARLIGNRIEENTVIGQAGSAGGGVLLEGTRATLIDNLIVGNLAPDDGQVGGGIGIQSGGPVILVNNRIEGNRAGGTGVTGLGGGISISNAEVHITGGVIAGNTVGTSGSGGGLYALNSAVTLEGVLISDNAAGTVDGLGGGIMAEKADGAVAVSTLLMGSSLVVGNRNGMAGVWLGFETPSAIINCTVADNSDIGVRTESALTVANTIFLDESVGVTVEGGVPVIALSNDFFGLDTSVTGFTLDGTNLTVDPVIDEEFHLAESSPLLDIGLPGPFTQAGASAEIELPDTDLDGEPRRMIGPSDSRRVDIGADERTGPTE
jgi:Bacterial Ig-like domain/Right handed beta helix region